MKIAGGIKVANQLILKLEDNPGYLAGPTLNSLYVEEESGESGTKT